jgi:hypothetical protein
MMNLFHTIAVARAGLLPRITLAQRVVDKMVQNALIYDTETGEALVGFAIKQMGRSEPDLYVVDTISPDASAIRRGAYFEQGDTLQDDIFTWWHDNWNKMREKRRKSPDHSLAAKWDIELVHLGDWHKHPGTLVEPSWGDTDTARGRVFDEEIKTPQILAILATVWDRARAESESFEGEGVLPDDGPQPLKIAIDDRTLVRLDCWYMSQVIRRFVRLTPVVVPDKALPSLSTVSWHLANQDRWNRELEALSKQSYSVSPELYNGEEADSVVLTLEIAKRGSQNIFIVLTQPDYPKNMPTIRTVPMSAVKNIPEEVDDLFMALWKQSQPLDKALYPDWQWTPEKTILDLIQAVEAKLTERNPVA